MKAPNCSFGCEEEMVQVTFTWRRGGRQVFLYGSFNSWNIQILMNLVETSGSGSGSVPVFQTIVNLPPGYHQYKFLVDGIWQVDEQQLCVQDEYGVINNLVYVQDVHSELASDFARSVQLEASSSSRLLPEPVMQFLDNEMNVSRHRLCMFLSSSTAYELIPDSGKVFALDDEVAVKQAFHVMYEQGLAVMPLWDERNARISGMLTSSDFILILLKLHGSHSMLTSEQLEMHTVSAWKYEKLQLLAELSGAMIPPNRRVLLKVSPDESLKDVALTLLQNKISAVPVLHSPEDGSCAQLLHTVCLAGILKRVFFYNLLFCLLCLFSPHNVFTRAYVGFYFFSILDICRYFRNSLEFLPLLQQPVGNLPIGTWAREVGARASIRVLFTLHSRDLLSSALKLLIEGQISSVPIIDDNGALINVYSRSDVTSLVRGNVYARFRLDQMIMTQVLEVSNEASGDGCKTCTRFNSLHTIMELLSDPIVRRIVVIDPISRRVEGIITLKDVFNLLLS